MAACPIGTFDKGGICVSCSPKCEQCTDEDTCQRCSDGFVLGGTLCYSETVEHAITTLTSDGNSIKTYDAGSSTAGDLECIDQSTITEYRLSDATVENSADSDSTLTIRLSDIDLNELKKQTALAVTQETTFLSASDSMIEDTSANSLVPNGPHVVCGTCFGTCTCTATSLAVTGFVQDNTAPELLSFLIDMDGDGSLTLFFSETYNFASVTTSQLTLKSNEAGAESVVLSGSSYKELGSNTMLKIVLTAGDLNAIKSKRLLAVDAASTYMTITDQFVEDTALKKIEPVTTQVTDGGFAADATKPSLSEYTFDLHDGKILMTFDETIDAATFDQTKLMIQQSAASTNGVRLTGDSEVSDVDSTIIVVTLSATDLNAIKANADIAFDRISTYLVLEAEAAKDMPSDGTQRTVNARNDGAAALADDFKEDEKDPTINSAVLNLNDGTVTLTLSEAVKGTSVAASSIKLQSTKTSDAVHVTLGGSVETPTNSITQVIKLDSASLDGIKLQTGLGTDATTTFLTTDSSALTDMASRPVSAILSGNAGDVSSVLPDSTAPLIESIDLDMHTSQLSLSFNEPVTLTRWRLRG
jgi:hypothetical protein